MLSKIRLELARTPEVPAGDPRCGYELVAPLDPFGHIDHAGWRAARAHCRVRRFWAGADDEHGRLAHSGRGWYFDYGPGHDDDEPVFKLDRHVFVTGEYIAVTEHDGVTRPFRIAAVTPIG